jgi:hypothetical protein
MGQRRDEGCGILTSSGEITITSMLKRPRKDADASDGDYEPGCQGPAKISKISRHGAMIRRRSHDPKYKKASVSIGSS